MIDACRVCGSSDLTTVLDLGDQALTGRFPLPGEDVPHSPLTLVWCRDCTLLQLGETPVLSEMYGENYGYRSGLNRSMVRHLGEKVQRLERFAGLAPGDTVLDIGCNDGTLLGAYTTDRLCRIGIDPTAGKFAEYHPEGIWAVPEFFSAERFHAVSGQQAKVITSIACFYDLEDPVAFARDVAACLAPDGIWHLEQSYMPSILDHTAYDMVCHEHLEYYSLTVIKRILDGAGLEILDVEFNDVNGGSFAVTAANRDSLFTSNHERIGECLTCEYWLGLDTSDPFRRFEARVFEHRDDLTELVCRLRADGHTIMGYGASTKGNTLLQFCGLGPDLIDAIAEVNEDKYGHVTPGTGIPIIPEGEMRERRPDFLLVLPWHFRDGIVEREREYLEAGGRLIFPLPEIEIVGA